MLAFFRMPWTHGRVDDDLKRDQEINRFTLRLYISVLWQFRRWTLAIVATSIITTTCFGALLPYFLAQAIELVSRQAPLIWGGELSTMLGFALGAAILGTVGVFIGVRNFAHLDTRAQSYLRAKILDRLTHESAAFYANSMSGSLTSNLNAYLNGYMIVQELVITRGAQLLVPLVVGVGIAASQSWLLAELFLLITCMIALKTLIDSRHRAPFRRARKTAMSRLNGFVADVISNNGSVRAFAGERFELETLEERQQSWREACFLNLAHFGRHSAILQGSINILQVGGVAIAAWMVASGHIGLGLAIFAITYFQRLSSSLFDLGPAVQAFQGAMTDSAPISEILMETQSVTDFHDAKALNVPRGEIQFENIGYRYEEDSRPVFRHLALHIPAGQKVGVVGYSGSGKTTLTHLLLRFDDVQSGRILIDGQDIAEVTQQSLRRAISYVPQDSQLFHRTLRENIAYGNPQATEADIIAASKRLISGE